MKRVTMNKLIPIFVAVSISVLLGCSENKPATDSTLYLLSYGLQDTTRFRLTTTFVLDIKRVVQGNELANKSIDRVEYEFEMKSGGKKDLELEVEYKDRQHESSESRGQANTDFSELIGKKVSLSMSPEGEMSNFQGFEDLPAVKMLDREITMGKDRYVNEVSQIFPHLPGKKIRKGDSWSHVEKYDEPLQGGQASVTINYTHTLVEEEKKDGLDCLKLDGRYTISIEGKGVDNEVEFDLKLDGEGTETVYFVHEKGVLLNVESRGTISGAAANEEMGLRLTIDQNFETTIDVDLEQD